MRYPIRRLLPSMFHRRLMLLAICALVMVGILAVKLTWLTTAEAAVRKQNAERVLRRRTFLTTVRGSILDRYQRYLAKDRASYDVAVHYSVITGKWAYDRARRQAYVANRHRWSELGDHIRERLTLSRLESFEQQMEDLWRRMCDLGGASRDDLDRDKARIIGKAQAVWADHLVRRRKRRQEQLARQGLQDQGSLSDVAQQVQEQDWFYPLLRDMTPEARLAIERRVTANTDNNDSVWRWVRVVDTKHRVYPYETMTVTLDRTTLPLALKNSEPIDITVEGIGIHLIGAMRNAWKEVQDHPFRPAGAGGGVDLGGYRTGDRAGYWGIERSQERWLRGLRGEEIIDQETRRVTRRKPVPGKNVVLSIDIHLQARLQALMSQDRRIGLMIRQPWHHKDIAPSDLGTPLNGAAVVLEVGQGQVLAAVSVPGFSRRMLAEKPPEYWQSRECQINRPRNNRPVASAYQPGSTAKPLVLAAAVSAGVLGYDEKIKCTGVFDPAHPNILRCWIYRNRYRSTHRYLGGPGAIGHSCNIFFYTMGRRLGTRRLVEWYARFGLGRRTGVGLVEEVAGHLPDLRHAREPGAAGFAPIEALFMAIGQGPIAWTPLQAANAYAALAREGGYLSPMLLLVPDVRPDSTAVDLQLDWRGRNMALEGMRLSANEPGGTTHHITHTINGVKTKERIFNIEGLKIRAKSGTAQTAPLRIDSDGDGRITRRDQVVKKGDHAWVICLVEPADSIGPQFVVAVVVEHAGSGARVAGPIVNQILHAMRAEGYL